MAGKTLYDKIYDAHLVAREADGTDLLYIDLHLIHEVTTPQAFAGLKAAGRKVRRPDLTLATADHNTPTEDQALGVAGVKDPEARRQLATLEQNVAEAGIEYFPMGDINNGIVHMVGPEQGRTQPGMTIVCGDSHTSTHGAFGALAFGIGTSEVGHVMATQCLLQRKPKTLAVTVEGALAAGVGAKDLALAIIGRLGVAGGAGQAIEYRGAAIRALSMDERMTVCNMSIEAGARAGMIEPDDTTFEYLRGRPRAPQGEARERAIEHWRALAGDDGARFDGEATLDAGAVEPMISYGTNPGMSLPIGGRIPERGDESFRQALRYMGFAPGEALAGRGASPLRRAGPRAAHSCSCR